LSLEAMLDEAGAGKPSKEEQRAIAARERLLEQVLGDEDEKSKGSGYADPALWFS
jgi:hypothetical protein